MKRRNFISLIFCGAGACKRADRNLTGMLPVQVQRAWTLKQTAALAQEDSPAILQTLGVRRGLRARYQGNGAITVRLFEMPTQTNAFEAIQKWNQKEGLAFYKSEFFVIANGEGPDQATVSSFLAELERELKLT